MSQLGCGEEALECYDAAVQIEPLSAMLRHNRGYRRLRLGHEEGARTDLRFAANLGGESKWGRQARRLLLEQWGEKVHLQTMQTGTEIHQPAPSTPGAERFSRGSRTVEAWLKHGSASPSEMLHHNLDSVSGPLTMTIQSTTTGDSGQAAQAAHTAQALPPGFSISSPMHWPAVQLTSESFRPASGRSGSPSGPHQPTLDLGTSVVLGAPERHTKRECTSSDPHRTWWSRDGRLLQVQTTQLEAAIDVTEGSDQHVVELCRIACVRQRGGVELVVELSTKAIRNDEPEDTCNGTHESMLTEAHQQVLRFELGDAIANLKRVVAVAGPEDSRVLPRSSPEICTSARGATCNQVLLAGSDTKPAHALQDAGVARLARTVQGQLPLVANLTPDRLRQAIVRAISSALNRAPTTMDAGAPLQDGIVQPAHARPQAPAPSPASATVSETARPVSPPSVREKRTTAVQQPSVREKRTTAVQQPPPVPTTAITSPRTSPRPSFSASSRRPPSLPPASTTPSSSLAPGTLITPRDRARNDALRQPGSADLPVAFTDGVVHSQNSGGDALQRIRALRAEVQQLREDFPCVVARGQKHKVMFDQ